MHVQSIDVNKLKTIRAHTTAYEYYQRTKH